MVYLLRNSHPILKPENWKLETALPLPPSLLRTAGLSYASILYVQQKGRFRNRARQKQNAFLRGERFN